MNTISRPTNSSITDRTDPKFHAYQAKRKAHWDNMAQLLNRWSGWGGSYHKRLRRVYGNIIPPGRRVLEIGCGEGELLAALEPSFGVGVDLSASMLQRAKAAHPGLHWVQADAHFLPFNAEFDVVILSDLINELWDLQAVLAQIAPLTHPHTRLVINTYNRLWEIPLGLAERFGLAKPSLNLNWFTVEDVTNLLGLENFEPIRTWQEVLLPLPLPGIAQFFNRFLVRLWPFRHFALTNFIAARPTARRTSEKKPLPRVSVIVPARNEAGNIPAIFDRVPTLGAETELVFVEGHSQDNTFAAIQETIAAHPEQRSQLFQQTGEGKGDAVRLGFEKATGEILLILDADLTVPPEDLVRFTEVLISSKGDFVNGVRLVYPIEDEAMRAANFLGNKFFSLAFSWLFGQPIKDTLCGTKGLWKEDYQVLAENRAYFGRLDPFGDFDLLLGAARMNLKIVDLPVRYRSRTYGETNIQRWKHGWLLLRMLGLAARRLKFI
ncbi:MAG: glycosyltransferase [Anaerolineales bacterium]